MIAIDPAHVPGALTIHPTMPTFDPSSSHLVSAVCALSSVLSYGYFSRRYEPLVRKAGDPLVPAALLYGLAALFLGAGVVVAATFLGSSAGLPSATVAFNVRLDDRRSVLACLAILVALMSFLYSVHIGTEARCRRSVNMGVYAVIFQVHVIVIAIVDWLIYRVPPSWPMILGGLLVFGSSMGVLSVYLPRLSGRSDTGLFDVRADILGIVSAAACGLALCIDGEVGRRYVFHRGFRPSDFPAFLFYEALTFGLPSLCVIVAMTIRSGYKRTCRDLVGVFRHDRAGYFWASAFSALHFVFAVFALSLPGSRFAVAMILSLAPVISVFLDRNVRPAKLVRLEYALALVAVLGLILMLSFPASNHR
jgi:drug/metabolite transporter (DMT)-like permease